MFAHTHTHTNTRKGLFNPGKFSLEKLIRSQAQKFGIRIYDLALSWNHIHCLLKIKDRRDCKKFIRSLTATLAIQVRKSKPYLEKIFDLRPFTRILSWGRDFKRGLDYQILNQMEAFGLVVRKKKTKSKPRSKIAGEKKPTNRTNCS